MIELFEGSIRLVRWGVVDDRTLTKGINVSGKEDGSDEHTVCGSL